MSALLFAGCKKKDAEPAADASTTTSPAEVSDGKVAHIVLKGDLIVVPGMKMRSKQVLKMKAGNFTTASDGGTSQGAMSVTDSETRDIEFVSEREQIVTLKEKESKLLMDNGGAEQQEITVKSALLGQKISAHRKNGNQWWYGLSEGEPDDLQTKELQVMSESEVLSVFEYPEKPVTLGQEWEASGKVLQTLLGSAFTAKVARVHFRMNGVKTYEGQRCAELGVRIEAMGDYLIGEANLPAKMIIDMSGTLLHSLNTFQDLKVDLKGVMTLEHSPGEGTKIMTDGNIEFQRENKIGD